MRKTTTVFFAIIVFAGCKKEIAVETLPPITVTQTSKVTDYYPLTVGSYWIYHVYEIDTNLIDHYWTTDTIRIVSDTLLDEKKYYYFKGNYFGGPFSDFITDSLDYIIYSDGTIILSNSNFTDTLRVRVIPGISTSYYKMFDHGRIVSVPAGTFPIIDREQISYYDNPNYPYGNPRTATRNYAKGVGMIKDRNYMDGSPKWLERRLVQYHIAE